MKPKKKVILCITEYVQIVRRHRKTEGKNESWKRINDVDMFAKGIHATEVDKDGWEADGLEVIIECLQEELRYDKSGLYFLDVIAQKPKKTGNAKADYEILPIFLELCYIAFQKKEEYMTFIKAFLDIHYLRCIDGEIAEGELERYQKVFQLKWIDKLCDLYQDNINSNKNGKNRSKLSEICRKDNAFFGKMEENCVRGEKPIRDRRP